MLDDFLDAPTRRSAIPNQTKILIVLNFFASGSYPNSVVCTIAATEFWPSLSCQFKM
jgi:hypothetical protein